jgi:hypothetical protein
MTDSITIGARSGGVCILNAATALRETVFAAADSVGCGKYVPKQAATTTTLSLAMREVGNTLYGKRRKQPIVARHIDGDSFECVRVVAHGDRNEYHHLFSASIDKQWNVTVLAHNHDQQGYMLGQCLTNSVVRLRDYLPSPVVSQVAVNILTSWKGVLLKDDGGVWFLADEHLDKYRTLAAGLRRGGGGPNFTLTTFPIDANPDTVAHVIQKVRDTVSQGVDEIMQDVMEATGGMNDRSVNVRLARANKLLALVEQYQSLTGIAMPELTDAIERCKQAVALNRLLAAAV